jgi:hypothetical protein
MKFYGHFAACYGTFWALMMTAAVIGQTHINAGAFGLWGFPVLALLYACCKTNTVDTEVLLQKRIYELEDTIEYMENAKRSNEYNE